MKQLLASRRFVFKALLAVGLLLPFMSSSKDAPVFVRKVEGISEYSLSNGLQILLIPDASQSNMVVNIVYKVGSRHEGYGETGMAHLLEHMLFKSTKNLGDIKKMLSDKGGNANGTTWYDRTNYYEIFPSSEENLKWSIQMEADRMVNATILQSDLDKEFSVVRNEFEIGENEPGSILMERILSTAYLWHNYGNSTIGSREDIERVKADRLRVFYRKYYQPDNATLIVAGKFDSQKALQYIGEYFSVIPRPERVIEKTYTVEPAQDGERYVELKRAGDVQYIGAAYHASALADEDYPAMDVLAEILQADPSGYLYKAMVETRKAASIYCYQQTLHDPGFMYFGVEVPKDKSLDSARTAFVKALDAIATTDYTEADLQRGKAKVVKQVEDITNNTVYFAINLTEIIGAGDYRLWPLYRDRVDGVKLSDVKRVAARYFRPNNRTLGIFLPSGNEERVKPEEFDDERIASLAAAVKGKAVVDTIKDFEASIRNVKANMNSRTLSNGFRYSFVRKPVKGGKVNATVIVLMGDEKSLSGKREVAALTASLLKAGTSTMSKEKIQDKLDSLKSSVYFQASGQRLYVYISSYVNNLDAVLAIVKDCMRNPAFPQEELDKTKMEYKSSFESQLNDPQSIAFTQLSRHTESYPKEDIRYSPSPQERIADQGAVTLAQIRDFHAGFYGTGNACATMVGDLDSVTVGRLMESAFGGWTSKVPFTMCLPVYEPSAKYSERIETPDKENGAFACGLNIRMSRRDPDFPALMMANEMLGSGGFLTSRIPTRLREKEGISYGAGSFLDVPVLTDAASWGGYAFYNPKMVDKVDMAFREEIARAVDSGFTAAELKSSITSWRNERNTSLGTDSYIINLVNSWMLTGLPIEDFDELERKVDSLTVEQVNAAAKKYILPEKMVFIFAGDFKKK
jgi:zinc protease